MFKPVLPFLVFLAAIGSDAQVQSQPQSVIVPSSIRFPADSIGKEQLVQSFNGFLTQLSGSNKDNSFIQPDYLPETSDLCDEIKGMDRPLRGWNDSCHCYLTNVTALDSTDYIVQFSYLGIRDASPVLRASFRLLAHHDGARFLFSSPLRRNTSGWHVKKDGDFIFSYNNFTVADDQLNAYVKKAREFDSKLKAPSYLTRVYCCSDFPEAEAALGVDYKLDYNGYLSNDLTAFENHTRLSVAGGTPAVIFDLHDLWHDRLHATVPVATINKPMDEACAYLYGGSWGLTWEEILRQFKTYMGTNKDWLTAFTENKNFGASDRYHLYVSYVIDALLAQRIEKEKGFPAVMQLLTCGHYQKDNDNYFAALDRIIGVNRTNFNTAVEKLVEAQL